MLIYLEKEKVIDGKKLNNRTIIQDQNSIESQTKGNLYWKFIFLTSIAERNKKTPSILKQTGDGTISGKN